MRVAVALLLVVALALPAAVQAQAASAPPFVTGPNKSYCHVIDASNTVWMNTLEADGDEAPYEIFGAPATTVPVANLGVDPVTQTAFETRIPLAPALTQSLVLEGTINVQAYIGGGSATAGTASIAAKLFVDGAQVAAAAAKSHTMTPAAQAGMTYNPITWTMAVAGVTVPAGATVEWVLSGTASGNNVFLACHAARGRSYIELPVASAAGGSGTTVHHNLTGAAPSIVVSAVNGTDAVHAYNWSAPAGPLEMRLAGNRTGGNLTILVRDAANATLANLTFLENRTVPLNGTAGNWTITVTLDNFTGDLTAAIGPPVPVADNATSSGTQSTTRTATTTGSGSGTTGNETSAPDQEEAPAAGLLPLVAVLALAAVWRRRR